MKRVIILKVYTSAIPWMVGRRPLYTQSGVFRPPGLRHTKRGVRALGSTPHKGFSPLLFPDQHERYFTFAPARTRAAFPVKGWVWAYPYVDACVLASALSLSA